MNKHIIWGILVLCVAGGVLGLMLKDQLVQNAVLEQNSTNSVLVETQKLPPTDTAKKSDVFKNSSDGVIQVFFDMEKNTAIVNADGQGDVVFTRAISASGARYENKILKMALWNKGDVVTLYQGEKVVFEGTKQ
ncbi:MAG: MliC family protein [Patescibacteria group bacterium]